MNMHDIPLLTIRIRNLQSLYAKEHEALSNWGLWGWDRRGIFPGMSPPSIWSQFCQSKVEDWGDEQPAPVVLPVKAKAEPPPIPAYNERNAIALDERLHGAGGPAGFIRQVAKVAYVTREVPEEQFAKLSGCTEDAFCERLETLLLYVRRFV
jgi:hypothetical protein